MNSQKLHFIVADDDERARYLIEFVLRRTYPTATLLSFLDGNEALECFLQHGADAIITDHSMPNMTGADLARVLKGHDPSLPIVMISNSPFARAEGLAAGVDRYLDKRDALASLPMVLSELLEARQTEVPHRTSS
jgi:CheY-like chemotaxis protein